MLQYLEKTFNLDLSTLRTAMAGHVFGLIATLVIGFLLAKVITLAVDKTLSKLPLEKTLYRFIRSVVRIVVYFIWILEVASRCGLDAKYLVTLASVLSAAFALAAQGSLSNLFGGVLLLVSKPFLVGDYVIAGGVEGTVLQIGLLNTQINTLDNKRISVPNSTISSATITNCSTEGKRRVDLTFSASYDNDTDQVKRALMEAVSEVDKIVNDPIPPFIRVSEYGQSGINYVVKVWCLTSDYWEVYYDLLEKVKESFDRNGVEMPYNHVVIQMEK